MKIFWNPDYTASGYAFDTTRKSAHIAERVASDPNFVADRQRLELANPNTHYAVADEYIRRFHDHDYVEAVRTGSDTRLAGSQGFPWDEYIYPMARAHVAGCLAAVDEACQHKNVAVTLSSGLHHARRENGVGFCTFNGVALAARYAESKGLTSLVIDLDAHCGGGTYSMINHDTTYQWDMSTNRFDSYVPEDQFDQLVIANTDEYITSLIKMLNTVDMADINPDIIIYNAGVDPLNDGLLEMQLHTREKLMSGWLAEQDVPVVVTMAGGYTWGDFTMEDITDAHMTTITEMRSCAVQQSVMRRGLLFA